MSNCSNSAAIEPLVRRNQHFFAVGKALRLLVGRGRRYTYKDVQRGAGVPERMLRAFKEDPGHEEFRPIAPEQFASLVVFLGADFTSEYLEGISAGQGAYDLPDEDVPPPGVIAADAAEDSATLSRMAVDGGYSGKPELKVMGSRMVSRGAGLVKMALAA